MDSRFQSMDRLGRLEAGQARLETTQAKFEATQSEIKSILSRLEPVLMRTFESVAELKGRTSDMPTARDFGRLEGRVAEMSERLLTTLGYRPPSPGKKAI